MQKPLFLLVFFLLNIVECNSQANKEEIDSLYIIQSSKLSDTIKINKILRLTYFYQDVNPREAKRYLFASEKMLKTSFFKNGWAQYLFLKSRELNIEGEFIKAIKYSQKARFFSLKNKLQRSYLKACNQESFLRTKLYGHENSLAFLKNIIHQNKNSRFYNELGELYSSLARFQQYSNHIISCLSNYKKAVNCFRKVKNEKGVYNINYKLCEIYILTNDKVNASYYFKLLKDYSQIVKSDRQRYHELFLEGDINALLNNYEKAIKIFQLALEYNNKLNDNVYRFIILDKLNKLYIDTGKSAEAINFCLNEINYGYNDVFSSYFLNINTALAFYSTLDLTESKIYYDKACKLFNELNRNESTKLLEAEQVRFYQFASKLEFSLKNYKKAYELKDLYEKINESYIAEQNTKRLQELQTLYDTNEKEYKIKEITYQNNQKSLQIKKQTNDILIISFVLFFLILTLVTLICFYVKNKKHNEELFSKNQIIDEKNKLLESSKQIILESVKQKDLLLKEIHHRIKNNLQLMISLLNIQARENVANISDFVSKSQSRITSMALIHQNLYETDNLSDVDFGVYLEKLIGNIQETFQEQSRINLFVEAKNIFLDIQTSIPLGLIINELVTNAFKHAFPDKHQCGEILVIFKNLNDFNYELTVKDNGIGYVKNTSFKKTLGLELVELLTIQINGELYTSIEDGVHYKIVFKSYGSN